VTPIKNIYLLLLAIVSILSIRPALGIITEYPAAEVFVGGWHHTNGKSLPPSGNEAINYAKYPDITLTPPSCTYIGQRLDISCPINNNCGGGARCLIDVEHGCNGADELFQKSNEEYWCRKNSHKDTCNTAGNPCQVSTGAKLLNESDLANAPLTFTRNYHSLNLADSGLGKGWHNPYFKSVFVSGSSLFIVSGSGRGEPLQKVGNFWQADADSDYKVTETSAGFTLTDKLGSVSEYSGDGRVLSEIDTQGRSKTYAYDNDNRLSGVTDHYGFTIVFGYSTNGKDHLISVISNGGDEFIYQYDVNDNLVAVIYPDGFSDEVDRPKRVYLYEDINYPNHLTGIIDENGDRFATYAYDSEGKAISTEHALTTNPVGQEKVELDYEGAN
jgi:YD repeat-containing protein